MIDRLVHPLRRRRAIAALRSQTHPGTILIVCHGNLCRSPYAALALSRRLARDGLSIRVESAGFSIPNRAPPTAAITTAARRDIDVSAHRSRTVTPALLAGFDLTVVVDPALVAAVSARQRQQRVVVLGDLDPHRIDTRRIRDPMGAGIDAFEACFARIDRCVDQLAGALVSSTPAV